MKRLAMLAFVCAITLSAAGCVMPKDFTAKMNVKKDGSYDFAYDGTVYYLAMLKAEAAGELTPEAEKDMSEEFLAKVAKDENASNASYEGDGVFKISYRQSGNINDDDMKLPSGWGRLPWFEFRKSDDVTHVVFQVLATAKEEKESAKLPAQAKIMNGTIEFSTELPVDGVTGNPEHKEGTDTYVWKVDGLKPDMPSITMKWVEPEPPMPPTMPPVNGGMGPGSGGLN